MARHLCREKKNFISGSVLSCYRESAGEAASACPSVLVRLVMLFYRYMLPHFTTEVYSWADPENEDSGFKTGVENGFSSWKRPF